MLRTILLQGSIFCTFSVFELAVLLWLAMEVDLPTSTTSSSSTSSRSPAALFDCPERKCRRTFASITGTDLDCASAHWCACMSLTVSVVLRALLQACAGTVVTSTTDNFSASSRGAVWCLRPRQTLVSSVLLPTTVAWCWRRRWRCTGGRFWNFRLWTAHSRG